MKAFVNGRDDRWLERESIGSVERSGQDCSSCQME